MKIDRLIQIKSNSLKPAKGRILLSEPFMGDYYFGRSVILLAEHDDMGSYGVVLNKALTTKLNEVANDFPSLTHPIFIGGPVETNRLFYIHRLGSKIEGSILIKEDLFWGGSMESVIKLADQGQLNEQNIRFFMGYSGWGVHQLENELKRNSWAITRISAKQIFFTPPELLWKDMTKKLGQEYMLWRQFPVDPNMN
jgi:putative transcriptional regulator